MPITTGLNPKALTGKVKKPKKASLPKARPSVAKPRKPSVKTAVPDAALDRLMKKYGI